MAAVKPVPRGFFHGLVDRLAGWSSNLPAERSSYSILPVRIPVDDNEQPNGGGVFLAADVYQPIFPASTSQQPLGTIVAIGPYGRRFPMSLGHARLWASRGYVVLFVSCRGTFGSSGVFAPGVDEERDCPRVIRWMRKQPWYTGRFATMGMSYLGYTQWAIMAASYEALGLDKDVLEKEHAAAVMLVGPHDFSSAVWGTGSLWMPVVDWASATQAGDKVGMLRDMYKMILLSRAPNGDVETKKAVPLLGGIEKTFGGGKGADDGENHTLEWLSKHIQASKEQAVGEAAGAYWRRMDQTSALETTRVPMLLVGGWQDLFIESTMEQWRRLNERGVTVGLTVGGWNHMESGNELYEWFDWVDTHLGQKTDVKPRPARARVQIMSTGAKTANEWKWFENWPPANVQPVPFQLASDSQLLSAEALSQTQTQAIPTDTASFTFDPHDPTPTMGGDLLFAGGYVDDSALALRSDVLSFTTPPLDKTIEVHGIPRIELLHSSDNPHVDLFIRLSAVEYKNGKAVSQNVCQVYRRLDPERVAPGKTAKIELELSGCAHRFGKGTSIRVLVAGANFPHYAFNLGSGEPQGTGTTLRPAKHTVHLGGSEGSRLILPVLPEE